MRNTNTTTFRSRTLFSRHLCLIALAALVACTFNYKGRASSPENVRAMFGLTITDGPFPSDRFTVADPSQNTGLRIDLPKPDCVSHPDDCRDIDVLNTLDGFNMQPRISIPFDGAIDVSSVTSESIFLIRLGNTLDPRDRDYSRIRINQIVWDPATHTLHVQPDEMLAQHTRYAVVVTNGLLDESGLPVEPSESFMRFRRDLNYGQSDDPAMKSYRKALLDALKAARAIGVSENEIVVASVFSTQSSTSVLEKIRDQIKSTTAAPANFNLGTGGARTVFSLDQVTAISWRQQKTLTPVSFTTVAINPALLRLIPGAVGRIAFGKYSSPDYMVHPGEYIPAVGTRSGTPEVQAYRDVYFNLYLPSGPRPAAGWPIVIVGHGSGSNKNNVGANVAAGFAAQGIATIAINQAGHGFGPVGTLTVNQTGVPAVTFTEGGRGIDQNGDNLIDAREGDEAIAPRALQLNRDGVINTLGDVMQLIQVMKGGMDVEGDGAADIDASRIYYFGASLGGIYATMIAAVEPDVQATVANVAGGALIENRRLFAGTDSFRSRLAEMFASRQPSLLNGPGVNRLAGVVISGPRYFNENMPLRDGTPLSVGLEDGTSAVIQSPVTNNVTGAMALQEWFDRAAWAAQGANPVAYAAHIRRSPLAGVPVRPVLFTFAKGDQSMPNPSTTAILRAGGLADRTVFYRHDLAFAEMPGLPKDPHLFTVGTGNVALRPIALEAQRQAAMFFASNGGVIIHPEPARYFEIPITMALPEGLDYIP